MYNFISQNDTEKRFVNNQTVKPKTAFNLYFRGLVVEDQMIEHGLKSRHQIQ